MTDIGNKQPKNELRFYIDDESECVGKLFMQDGKMAFEGKVDPAARFLFEQTQRYHDSLQERHAALVTAARAVIKKHDEGWLHETPKDSEAINRLRNALEGKGE